MSYVSFIPFFSFWFLVTFGDKVTKIQKYYIIFVYILQVKMGKMEKNRKENHATKVTKIPIKQKTEIWDERNKRARTWKESSLFILKIRASVLMF